MMNNLWPPIASRIVEALGVQAGELIQVREGTGRFDVLQQMLLAIERMGATPLAEFILPDYLERLWSEAPLDYLAQWDHHRLAWMGQYNRVLRLQGGEPDISRVRQEGFQAWLQAIHRLTVREEERRLPFLVVAIPTA